MTFSIRKATSSDAIKIHNAHMASIRHLCSKDYTEEQIESWTSGPDPQSYIEAMEKGETMFVALVGDDVIGFSGARDDEVRAVYVHPDHIGIGVGASLLREAEQELIAKGCGLGRLNSTITAREFYISRGWEVEQETVHELRSGMKIPCIGMKKRFAGADSKAGKAKESF